MKHSKEDIKKAVKNHYAAAITQKSGSCCSPQPVEFDEDAARRFVQMAGYTAEELRNMPQGMTSFGCGNPVNFMEVRPGQTVLDLGSGAGMDLILAAARVGPEGRVIGLDMTPEMIEVCRKNLATAKILNAEVRQGEMEDMPVADNEVDWIISNCVINLSPEKDKVFAEAFRVLKPGGRVMISDIVTLGLPDEYRNDIKAWVGCIAGAVEEDVYLALMRDAGFEDVRVVDRLVYDETSLHTLANDACGCGDDLQTPLASKGTATYAGKVASVKVSARKPQH
jgi:SAM-dependent methyltransferase